MDGTVAISYIVLERWICIYFQLFRSVVHLPLFGMDCHDVTAYQQQHQTSDKSASSLFKTEQGQ